MILLLSLSLFLFFVSSFSNNQFPSCCTREKEEVNHTEEAGVTTVAVIEMGDIEMMYKTETGDASYDD